MDQQASLRLATGVTGLDEILEGGLVPGRAYLVRGGPGTGKTLLGLHFLTEGVRSGERSLFITMEEAEGQLRENAAALGLDLGGVLFLDLTPSADFFARVEIYDIFSPAEVEREPTTQKIIQQVQALRPQRIVLEGVTQFRYLSPDTFQFRRQVLSLLRFLTEQGTTVLLTSESSPLCPDDDLQFMCDGVINLDLTPLGRHVSVQKLRGSDFRTGAHSLQLTAHGMAAFPHLLPEAHARPFAAERVPSGVGELDEMLCGGLQRGTVTIITGPSGVGKTTVGLLFIREAARRGERSVVYLFEEGAQTLLHRAQGIYIPVRAMTEAGTLAIEQVEPLRYSPDEFAAVVRREVERNHARIVMLDSIAGYKLSMRGEDLVAHLHALSKYLRNMGTTTLLINEVEAITGDFRVTEVGVSCLMDNILFLRYLEMRGELTKAIGVLKSRSSDFDKALRELEITRHGVRVGGRLTGLRGILTGTPQWDESPQGGNGTRGLKREERRCAPNP